MKMKASLESGIMFAIVFAALAVPPAQAEIKLDEAGKIGIYGDARIRLEADWASRDSSGAERSDRNRLRTRLRLGLNVDPADKFRFGFRIRSGSDYSHQSPHITLVDFDDNDTGNGDFNFDKWFAAYSTDGGTVWAGRNSLPFWKQNELFWDDDVTPVGVGTSFKIARFDVNAGYFTLPAGMRAFSGNLAVGQVVYSAEVGTRKDGLTLAGGFLGVDSNPGDADSELLLDNNGNRDYRTWIFSGQYKTSAGDRPLSLGFDYVYNSESYSPADPDPFTAFHADETEGFVAQLSYGSTKPGQWLAAYYYASIDTFAFSSSYSQDDWMRWGSANETRSTNFSGHEFRFSYGLMDNVNAVARLYIVEARALRSPSAAFVEDGNRFRLDVNFSF